MYFECALLTYIPYKLIDRGRTQHTPNSVVKESVVTKIGSIFDHFELRVSGSDHLHAGEHVV